MLPKSDLLLDVLDIKPYLWVDYASTSRRTLEAECQMSLGRSSRFRSLGLAKVKSEKVLSSFASASSIAIHHGSMLCCQHP